MTTDTEALVRRVQGAGHAELTTVLRTDKVSTASPAIGMPVWMSHRPHSSALVSTARHGFRAARVFYQDFYAGPLRRPSASCGMPCLAGSS